MTCVPQVEKLLDVARTHLRGQFVCELRSATYGQVGGYRDGRIKIVVDSDGKRGRMDRAVGSLEQSKLE